MTCEQYSERWTDYIFRELPEETLREMRDHLEGCAACRAEVEAIESAIGAVKEGLPLPAATEEFVRDTVRKAEAQEEERRRPPFWLWAPAAAAVVVGLFLYGMFHLEFVDTRSKIAQRVEAQAPLGAKAEGGRQQATDDRQQAIGGRQRAGDKQEPFQEEDKALGGLAVPTADAEMARKRADIGNANELQKVREQAPSSPALGTVPAPAPAGEPVARENEAFSDRLEVLEKKDAGASADESGMLRKGVAATGHTSEKSGQAAFQTAEAAKPVQGLRDALVDGKEKRQSPSEEANAPAPAVVQVPTPPRPAAAAGAVGKAQISSYEVAKDSLERGVLPPPAAIRTEDFTGRFPPPHSEEARRLAGLFAKVLQGGNRTSKADYREFLKEAARMKPLLETDEAARELLRMIETAAKIREGAPFAAGTGQDGAIAQPNR